MLPDLVAADVADAIGLQRSPVLLQGILQVRGRRLVYAQVKARPPYSSNSPSPRASASRTARHHPRGTRNRDVLRPQDWPKLPSEPGTQDPAIIWQSELIRVAFDHQQRNSVTGNAGHATDPPRVGIREGRFIQMGGDAPGDA